MSKILTVAQREFLETVRTRAFVIGVVLMPALILGVVYASQRMVERAKREVVGERTIAVVDQTGHVADGLRMAAARHNQENPNRTFKLELTSDDEAQLQARIRGGTCFAYIFVPADALTADTPVRLGRADTQLATGSALAQMIEAAVTRARFAAHDPPIEFEKVKWLERPVQIASVDPQTGAARKDDDEMARVITPFAFMFLLYMGTFGISMGLLTSVLEEKSSRVVEVLLAAISPTQLMAGKILGMVGVGAILLGAWGGVGYYAAESRGLTGVVTVHRLMMAGLYFVPGFLLMSSMLAAIGAACNTLKEAQSMSSPLSLLNIVPMVLWFPLSQYPNSALSVGLSFVPPITPFVMVLRVCADPGLPVWQIVATQAVLWASVALCIGAAGKIFRVGVLMYGKPPSLRELVRWLRYA